MCDGYSHTVRQNNKISETVPEEDINIDRYIRDNIVTPPVYDSPQSDDGVAMPLFTDFDDVQYYKSMLSAVDNYRLQQSQLDPLDTNQTT